MVYTYQRETDRAAWTTNSLRNAMHGVSTGGLSVREAVRRFGIPRTTLRRHIREDDSNKKPGGIKPVFDHHQELHLVEGDGYPLVWPNKISTPTACL